MYEPCGTREQVKQLHAVWDRLDVDNSGTVELHELKRFADRSVVQDRRISLMGPMAAFVTSTSPEENTKIIAKMCDRLTLYMVGRKTLTLSVEDFIEFLWPCAGPQERQTMKNWYDEFAVSNARWCVPAPEVCPPSKLKELKAVFRHFDKDRVGIVSVDELISVGLLHREMAKAGTELNLDEFFTMMCPTGFRPDSTAETGTTRDGERILLDHRLGCWRLENVDGIPGFPGDAHHAG